MLCNISISTINDNILTLHKTNYNINLFYPFIDRLMEFDQDPDFLHDEFSILITKEDLNSINTSNIKDEDISFLNELKQLSNSAEFIEIEGRFKRIIRIGDLN